MVSAICTAQTIVLMIDIMTTISHLPSHFHQFINASCLHPGQLNRFTAEWDASFDASAIKSKFILMTVSSAIVSDIFVKVSC